MQLDKIPATVVTGFLGSGKTTLLTNLLKQAGGKRIAVIVNEFGEMDVDSELLRSCAFEGCEENAPRGDDSGIYELANGCICCTVEEEFLPVMQKLVARRDEIDHIVIETSGLALPKPLVQAFNWPDIKQFCTVDAVITVVDGPALAAGRVAHDHDQVESQRLADGSLDHNPTLQELLDDQLAAADLVVITKADLLDDVVKASVEQRVRDRLPPSVKTLLVEDGRVDAAVLMGLNAASEERIEAIHTHHDHHHDHGHDHHHAHDDFDSCVLEFGSVDSDALTATLKELIAEHVIYRVKGFVDTGKPMRQVVHAVGDRITSHFDRLWQDNDVRRTRLVVIGQHLDESLLHTALARSETQDA
ncbi:cobalamin biosynthesis protein CobW [Phytohalomonas tamaricis]|uniref:cobalamin biosynthesis protein CobW n=1 Tax=Phytohalomonas tamaricis TaxID=2081032 RepID=UPI000D0B4C6E|nr:cobalamin biosynthesis protein CobW [Phytohalomonas tamaricis]